VEIGKLQLLQSLYLYGTRIKELPSSIVELRQLMFLSVDSHTSLPYGLRYLTSLEQLATVRVDFACTAEELGHLTQLRVLAVDLRSDKEGRWDKNICTVLVGSLRKLHKIQSLRVYSSLIKVAPNLEAGSVDSPCNITASLLPRDSGGSSEKGGHPSPREASGSSLSSFKSVRRHTSAGKIRG